MAPRNRLLESRCRDSNSNLNSNLDGDMLTGHNVHVDRSMRGPIWSDLGHLGLPDLVASTIMVASNSHVDGRDDKPSD